MAPFLINYTLKLTSVHHMKTQNCKKNLVAKLQMCTNYVLAIKKSGEGNVSLESHLNRKGEKSTHLTVERGDKCAVIITQNCFSPIFFEQ